MTRWNPRKARRQQQPREFTADLSSTKEEDHPHYRLLMTFFKDVYARIAEMQSATGLPHRELGVLLNGPEVGSGPVANVTISILRRDELLAIASAHGRHGKVIPPANSAPALVVAWGVAGLYWVLDRETA